MTVTGSESPPWTETLEPESVAELQDAVRTIASRGLAVYPQGGGTALGYGRRPVRPGVLIRLGRLNQVADYPHDDMTITVEAGLGVDELGRVLRAQGQFLPLDVPQADRATIGGVYATNACGSRRFGWGRPRDWIIGIEFVDAQGGLIQGGGRVVKNVAGYDFPKLLTGSLGTLGVIARLTFKVRPQPESQALVRVPMSAEQASEFWRGLHQSAIRPVVLDWLNASSASDLGARVGLATARGGASGLLIVGFEDNAASVHWQIDRLRDHCSANHLTLEAQHGADAQSLWSALADFPAPEGPDAEEWPLSIHAGLKPVEVARFADELDPDRWRVQCHWGSGIVRAHRRSGFSREAILEEIQRLRSLAGQTRGHMTVPRCSDDLKPALGVWGEPLPSWALSARVRSALDPQGIMNPGRFLNLD